MRIFLTAPLKIMPLSFSTSRQIYQRIFCVLAIQPSKFGSDLPCSQNTNQPIPSFSDLLDLWTPSMLTYSWIIDHHWKVMSWGHVTPIKMYALKICRCAIIYACVSKSETARIRTKTGQLPRKQRLTLRTRLKGNGQEFHLVKSCVTNLNNTIRKKEEYLSHWDVTLF